MFLLQLLTLLKLIYIFEFCLENMTLEKKLNFNIHANVIKNNLKYNPENVLERQYLMSTFCYDLSDLVRKLNINCLFTSKQPLYVKKEKSQKTEAPYLNKVLTCSFKHKGFY